MTGWRRRFGLVIGLALWAQPVAPSAAQDGGSSPLPGTDIALDGTVLTVVAGAPGSLRLTERPGEGLPGRVVRCGWFEVVTAGPSPFDIVAAVDPVEGDTYLLWCVFADGVGPALAGYPTPAVYGGRDLPGPVVSTGEAAQHALDSIEFALPSAVLTPPGRQIVGVPTDVEVVSRLDYPSASAEAGPVWATVQPEFHSVVWEPGNGDTVVCLRLAPCRSLYEREPSGGVARATVTVRWTIRERTDKTAGAWRVWGSVALTTPVDVEVTALQAAIR